jgi:small conductance mechanosensitive channel
MNFEDLPIDTDNIIALGLNAGSALIIAIIAFWVSSQVDRRIRSLPQRVSRFDPMVAGFLASMARYGLLAVAATFILSRLGIEATSLAAILGAAGLAIGLALQGTLSNMAAGVMIVIFRPFQLGDYITAGGHSGTVSNITLFFTELTTPDNQGIIIPNSDMWSKPIVNSSAHPTRLRSGFLCCLRRRSAKSRSCHQARRRSRSTRSERPRNIPEGNQPGPQLR